MIALPLNPAVVVNLADDFAMAPGASVAAYDTPASVDATPARATAVTPPMADDRLQPGASIAAYDR